ncbi:helicase HerA-like domain-containing protein [Deinococcus aquaedulcis]|uniref:helicase HerA-like domain-containing protein n=1 Tax=Deinococcus aquaedulcis TaxID=2840455 RepID=UPI001C82C0A6|nr:helicase HerA-like domain-containing protein [Deinococcus aquaedulcis]
MDYRAALAQLRAHLPPPSGGQARGSLRWLETQMRARGASPSSVRNIVYRGVGTPTDKAALRAILQELAQELGCVLPDAPPPRPALPPELDLLGRSKIRAYRQFVAGVRAGRSPRLIVAGRPGAGKTVLLTQVARTLRDQGLPVTQLTLSGDLQGVLPLGTPPGASFAAQAQAQQDAARQALPTRGALLVRVGRDLHWSSAPPRASSGDALGGAAWAILHLLERAPVGVAVLLALDGDCPPTSAAECIELRPPTPAEARAYLMSHLNVTRGEAERLVQEGGRSPERLMLLARLARAGAGPAELLGDPDTRRLAEATAALHAALPDPAAPWPAALLAAALGHDPAALPPHARLLLEAGPDGYRPAAALRGAWPGVSPAAQVAPLRALADTEDPALAPARLAAWAALRDVGALAAHLQTHPDDARHLPPLWPALRAAPGGDHRDLLARAVVAHHAGRGEYGAVTLRDALFTLLESARQAVRAWARVKLAESSLEHGNMDAAQAQLAHPDVTGMAGPDPWTMAAKADVLLVQAALARWRGDLTAATQAAADPRAAQGGPRAWLWRGLIAKDAGQWTQALAALQAVPAGSPLLSARARYQEGDLLLRLGQPAAALAALQDAAARLQEAGSAPEEQARVLARTATARRRLGRPAAGLRDLRRALALVPPDPRRHADGVPRARLLSEGVPLLLALGRPDEALTWAAQALDLLARPEARPAEAAYRARRTRYRTALAYLSRGLGRPYLQPLAGPTRDHPDLVHARALLDTLLAQEVRGADRDHLLALDLRLSRALAEPDAARALTLTQDALALAAHPYEQAQALALHAEAALRAGQLGAALAAVNRAHALLRRVGPGPAPADPGLHAQLLALEAGASVQDGPALLPWLRAALADPALAPFRAGVWREVGAALLTVPGGAGWLADWGVTSQGALALPDALVVHEQAQCPPSGDELEG